MSCQESSKRVNGKIICLCTRKPVCTQNSKSSTTTVELRFFMKKKKMKNL